MKMMRKEAHPAKMMFAAALCLFAVFSFVSCRNPAAGAQRATVSFYMAGGTPELGPLIVASGTLLQPVETPIRAGHRFAGWYKDADFTQPWDFDSDVVNGNMTLFARWVRAGGGGGGGGGSVGGPGGSGSNGGIIYIYIPDLIPGGVVYNVYQQLAWLHTNENQILGGPGRHYVAIAHDPVLFPSGITEVVPGDTGIGINFSNVSNVNVRIKSADPGPRRSINLKCDGVMINVGANNTLTLYNVDLRGLPGNNNPLVDVGAGTLVMENSQIWDNGLGVRVAGDGTFIMNAGAQVRDNLRHGVELIGSTAVLTMTNAQITGNGSALNAAAPPAGQAIPAAYMGSAVRVNNGTFNMNAGAVVQGLTGSQKPLVYISNGGVLTMTGTEANRAEIRNSGFSYNPIVRDRPYNLDIGGGRGVFVTAGGTIEMNTGARIFGHGNGGVLLSGVPLNHAALIMRGDSRIEYNAARGPASNFLPIISADFNRRSGGGVSSTDGTIRMYDTARIANNITTAGDLGGGGVLLMSTSRLYMNGDTAIYRNATTGTAGAVHIRGNASRLIMRDNSALYENRGGEGGAIRIQDQARVYMHNNASIHGNNRGTRTGGIELHGNSVLIMSDNTNISGNFLVNGNPAPQVFINGAWSHNQRDPGTGTSGGAAPSGHGIIRMSGGSIIPNGGCNTNPSVQIGLFGVQPAATIANFFAAFPSYTIVRYGELNPATGLLDVHNGFISITNVLTYTNCIIVDSITGQRVLSCSC